MALRPLPHRRLGTLIRSHLRTDEDPATIELIRRLRPARSRGYLTAAELEAICRWKSARAIRFIRANSRRAIRIATADALAARDERRRLEALTRLKGVSVPMASALMTLLDPRRYGVIDIRVWQLLFALRAVTSHPDGAGFSLNDWLQFLTIIRRLAGELKVKARDIERTLFAVHKEYQAGRLYG